jgi:hypothetical protein
MVQLRPTHITDCIICPRCKKYVVSICLDCRQKIDLQKYYDMEEKKIKIRRIDVENDQ